jgi:hypothetical protein
MRSRLDTVDTQSALLMPMDPQYFNEDAVFRCGSRDWACGIEVRSVAVHGGRTLCYGLLAGWQSLRHSANAASMRPHLNAADDFRQRRYVRWTQLNSNEAAALAADNWQTIGTLSPEAAGFNNTTVNSQRQAGSSEGPSPLQHYGERR